MNRKNILISIVLTIIILSGCSNRKEELTEDNISKQQTPSQNMQSAGRLSKSDEENVEENINGYNIEDDQMITQNSEAVEGNKISNLNQRLKTQILGSIDTKSTDTILEVYQTMLPEGIQEDIQYPYYNINFDYFLITADNESEIRENPTLNSSVIAMVKNLDKVSLYQRVQGEWVDDSDMWYRVGILEGDQLKEGYIHSILGTPRNYRFDKMKDAINGLLQEVNQGELHFISNYKNLNGAPPQKGNAEVDEYGYRVFHSAPAYQEANTNSDYRYIPDGILVRIIDETDEFYHVNVPTFGSAYYVPKKYIDSATTLSKLNHVIVVDRSQQNQASFEIGENGLSLVSYTMSSTGLPGNSSYETTLGSFKAIEKKDRFLYLKKDSQEIAGYAPYAIRFTGGAYIHGVPVEYKYENGQKNEPGTIEYLHTIGTYPRSSMCVRNYTSHAEFLYNWMDIKNGAVIVIE